MTHRDGLIFVLLALQAFAFLGMLVGALFRSGRVVLLCFLVATVAMILVLTAVHTRGVSP